MRRSHRGETLLCWRLWVSEGGDRDILKSEFCSVVPGPTGEGFVHRGCGTCKAPQVASQVGVSVDEVLEEHLAAGEICCHRVGVRGHLIQARQTLSSEA